MIDATTSLPDTFITHPCIFKVTRFSWCSLQNLLEDTTLRPGFNNIYLAKLHWQRSGSQMEFKAGSQFRSRFHNDKAPKLTLSHHYSQTVYLCITKVNEFQNSLSWEWMVYVLTLPVRGALEPSIWRWLNECTAHANTASPKDSSWHAPLLHGVATYIQSDGGLIWCI